MQSPSDRLQQRFGRLLAAHRRRLNLKQGELALRAEISSEMIGRLEQGKSGASFPTITKLADALGIDPAELFSPDRTRELIASKEIESLFLAVAPLDDSDIAWLTELVRVALKRP